MSDSLYDDPELYDAIAPADPGMSAFYTDGLSGGQSVLELACGTGRFSLPIARTGADLVATDIDEGMLDAARRRLADAGLSADFRRIDMRSLELDRRFARIVIAANSLMHLLTTEDLLACLTAARRHLAMGGDLRFDIFVPSVHLLAQPADLRTPLGDETFDTAQGPVTVEETIDYDPFTQISTATLYWSRPGQPDFRVTSLVLRQIFPAELPLLLDRAGLELVARHGDFAYAPFGSGPRQVCICRAAL